MNCVTSRPATGANHALQDESSLVEQAKSGDAAAFGRLYDALGDRVYRYIFFRVGDEQTAEDLTSQVFLKAWEDLRRYRPTGPFAAWLYTIARNTVIDHYRTRRSTVSLDEVASRIGHDPVVEATVDLHLEAKSLHAAMQLLTDEQREVLNLKFMADLDTAEIASHMRKTEGAIRALQMRALQALARIMHSERGQDT